jgi:PAS domain S-box-containing protein
MDSLKQVLDFSPTGFALTEINGEFRYTNDAICEILQYSHEELFHITWQEITHPEDSFADTAKVFELLSGIREHYESKKRYIRKDGTICCANLAACIIYDKDGLFDCFCYEVIEVNPFVDASKQVADEIEARVILQAFHNDFLQAIANNDLILHYQEIIDLRNNTVAGYEGLVRWQHPTRGLLYPNKFIKRCEGNADVMLKLGEWVFIQGNKDKHRLEGFLSLNMSGQTLTQRSFIELAEKYASCGDRPSVFLEIVETILADLENSNVLSGLEMNGYGFFVDDFGQGYSGLIQLLKVIKSLSNKASVRVKIDIWFTRNLHQKTIFTSMKFLLNYFRAIGIEAIAEGVETEEQLNVWKSLGCEFAQGYYWGNPREIGWLEL